MALNCKNIFNSDDNFPLKFYFTTTVFLNNFNIMKFIFIDNLKSNFAFR